MSKKENPLDDFFAPKKPSFSTNTLFGPQNGFEKQTFPPNQNFTNNFMSKQGDFNPNSMQNQQKPLQYTQSMTGPNNFFSLQNNFGSNQGFTNYPQMNFNSSQGMMGNQFNGQNPMMFSQQQTNFPLTTNFMMNSQQNFMGNQQMQDNSQFVMGNNMKNNFQMNPNQFQNFGQFNTISNQDLSSFGSQQGQNSFGSFNSQQNTMGNVNQDFIFDSKQNVNIQKNFGTSFDQNPMNMQSNQGRISMDNSFQSLMNVDQSQNFGMQQNMFQQSPNNFSMQNMVSPMKNVNPILSKVDNLFGNGPKVEKKDNDFDADFGDEVEFTSHTGESVQTHEITKPQTNTTIITQNIKTTGQFSFDLGQERTSIDKQPQKIESKDFGFVSNDNQGQPKTNSTPIIGLQGIEQNTPVKNDFLIQNQSFTPQEQKQPIQIPKPEEKKPISFDDLQLVSQKKSGTDSPAFSVTDFLGPSTGKKVQTKDLLTSLFGSEKKDLPISQPQNTSGLMSKVDTLFTKAETKVEKKEEDFDADFGEFQNTTETPMKNPLSTDMMFDSNIPVQHQLPIQNTFEMPVQTLPFKQENTNLFLGNTAPIDPLPTQNANIEKPSTNQEVGFDADFGEFESGFDQIQAPEVKDEKKPEVNIEPEMKPVKEMIIDKEIKLEQPKEEIQKDIQKPNEVKPVEVSKPKKIDKKDLLSLFDAPVTQPKPQVNITTNLDNLFGNTEPTVVEKIPEPKIESNPEPKIPEPKKEDDFDADFGDDFEFQNHNDNTTIENGKNNFDSMFSSEPVKTTSFQLGNDFFDKPQVETETKKDVPKLVVDGSQTHEISDKDAVFKELISKCRFEEAFQYDKTKELKSQYKRERMDTFSFEEMNDLASKKFTKKIPEYNLSELAINIKKEFDEMVLKSLEKESPSIRILIECLKELEIAYQMIEEMNEINQEDIFKTNKIISYFKGILQIYQISNSIIHMLMRNDSMNKPFKNIQNRLSNFKEISEPILKKCQLNYQDVKESDKKCYISGKGFIKGDDFCQYQGKDLYVPVANIWIHKISKEMFKL